MVEADAELVERVTRWCAEAGRQAAIRDIRRALAPLSWDELLAVQALLADPPPARPLGPFALADLARGAPPDLAAEREREGRYRSEDDATAPEPPPAAPPPSRRGAPRARRKGPSLVIRRARDAAPPPPRPPPAPPPLDDLMRPEGRTVIERLVRRHGARRPALVVALAAGWRRDDGGTPGEDDLSRLLDHHGLARAFERRERDELLHALRAAGGVRPAAAARLGLEPAALEAALVRLGAAAQAERIREERRAELRARGTLSERVRLLLTDEARLRDLGLGTEFEEDLRARLPEHVRALRAAGGPLALALARSLSVTPSEARTLAARFGIDLKGTDRAGTPDRGARRERISRPKAGGRAGAQGRQQRRPPRGPAAGDRGRSRRGPG